jgi:CubicO group peptidase (beta-lactamase class C family)
MSVPRFPVQPPSRWSRRRLVATSTAGILAAGGFGGRQAFASQATPAADIVSPIVEDTIRVCDLRSVLLHLEIGGETVASQAWGESIDGEAATVDMTVRTGEMPLAQLATLALILTDEGTIDLDDPIATWLPDLPDAGDVTCRMLANMTAGYRDYTQEPGFWDTYYADPTRQYSGEELLEIGLNLPRAFGPASGWEFSHTNALVLGQVLAAAAGQPLGDLLQERILGPAGMAATVAVAAPDNPSPTLHAFSAERWRYTDSAEGEAPLEDTAAWNPSWVLPEGARQVSNVADLARGVRAIGKGELITPDARSSLIEPAQTSSGGAEYGCTCSNFDSRAAYALGINLSGDWIVQSSNVAGYGSAMAWHSTGEIAVGLTVTYGEGSFDDLGQYKFGNVSERILLKLAETLVPQSMV